MEVVEIKEKFLKECKEEFIKCYQSLSGKNIVFWGSGSYCEMMVLAFRDIGMYDDIVAICDNNSNRWGETVEGKMVMNVEEVLKKHRDIIVVICSQFTTEIEKGLIERKIPFHTHPPIITFIEFTYSGCVYKTPSVLPFIDPLKWFGTYNELEKNGLDEKINKVLELLEDEESKDIIRKRISFFKTGSLEYLKQIHISDNIYFSSEYYPIEDEEVFVDVGAFDGDSIRAFLSSVNGKYKKIYAYEPDTILVNKIQKMIDEKKIDNIELEQYAIGNDNMNVNFSDSASSGSRIEEDGKSVVKMRKLDDLIKEKVTLLKMDIEGAEIDAIKGAEHLIKTYHPKLAISIYHRCEDIYEIPLLIHEMVPEYKFKVRHHTEALYDTVLYAWAE